MLFSWWRYALLCSRVFKVCPERREMFFSWWWYTLLYIRVFKVFQERREMCFSWWWYTLIYGRVFKVCTERREMYSSFFQIYKKYATTYMRIVLLHTCVHSHFGIVIHTYFCY